MAAPVTCHERKAVQIGSEGGCLRDRPLGEGGRELAEGGGHLRRRALSRARDKILIYFP